MDNRITVPEHQGENLFILIYSAKIYSLSVSNLGNLNRTKQKSIFLSSTVCLHISDYKDFKNFLRGGIQYLISVHKVTEKK